MPTCRAKLSAATWRSMISSQRREMWCIPKIDAICVVRMEDVLDLCAERADPRQRVVCADDGPTQLIGETWLPIRIEPGRPERYECAYRRNGTANLFVSLAPHRSWHDVKLTDRRAVADFAHGMREPVDTYIDQCATDLRGAEQPVHPLHGRSV